MLDQPEIEHLHHVGQTAVLTQDGVGRLDVAMDQPGVVRLAQSPANLLQDVDHPARWLRSVTLHELLEGEAGEQLHRVIKSAVRGAPVVVDGDGVGVIQTRRELHFALEAPQLLLVDLSRHQLHGGWPSQHGVARPVHLAHTARADLLLQRVLAEPPRFEHALLQAVNHFRGQRGQRRDGRRPRERRDREAHAHAQRADRVQRHQHRRPQRGAERPAPHRERDARRQQVPAHTRTPERHHPRDVQEQW